ncbi:putative N-6-adenine-methyltransferase [Aeromonas phage LAh_9]|uniref:Putative N-6-adenine-methyltransferase n=3 Tax=Lahexavirus TaxID=2843411 RepID=A0A514A0Z9_9CAUD|nr:DNA methyltransferase [Aeromonas phage LAh_6]YP_009847431.1 DNA methyltransferase [Aeromonas phage LAh_8]YP_009847610.1 DNA methyltransferase [Aeromonas phage LAh_9]QDH46534.1 putative DNA N-6-adenine-methyltransferase [Aeromonas phage LAh_6]QDH46771.1 putative N-6-adenine-methyltransferase [Aeromonas phage LAh_8]QDH46915.1 putative N-6-adenine-methyltransferase [Aeromonas phage LAh_9]
MKQEYTYESNTPEDIKNLWQTPQPYFQYWNDIYDFEMDVAAADYNHLCPRYFTETDDALTKDWAETNWCNPPYSDIGPWVEKAIEQVERGCVTVMLVPSNIDTKWFQRALESEYTRILIISGGRIKFIRADTQEPVGSNPRGSMFILFNPNTPNWSTPKIDTISNNFLKEFSYD